MELLLLVITPLVTPIKSLIMFPSIVIMVMVMTAQSGGHFRPPQPLFSPCPVQPGGVLP